MRYLDFDISFYENSCEIRIGKDIIGLNRKMYKRVFQKKDLLEFYAHQERDFDGEYYVFIEMSKEG